MPQTTSTQPHTPPATPDAARLAALSTLLHQQLEAPKAISPDLTQAITDQHNCNVEALPDFFSNTVPTLDDVALDLLFSPLYTPKPPEKTACFGVLEHTALTAEQLQTLGQQLAQQPVQLTVTLTSGETLLFPAPDVVIDQYLARLKLTEPLCSDTLIPVIQDTVPPSALGEAWAVARERIWDHPERLKILTTFLKAFAQQGSFTPEKLMALTAHVKSYRPTSLENFEHQLQSLIESCEKDLQGVHSRGYHHEHLHSKYANQVEADFSEGEKAAAFYHQLITEATALREDLRATTIQAG